MGFPQKINQLVAELTKLTNDEKLRWQETAIANTYLAPIDKFVVTVGKSGSEVYGGYSLQVLQKDKIIDGALATFRGPESDSQGFQNWESLRRLHELARRSALHSDQAVSDLLSSLQQIR